MIAFHLEASDTVQNQISWHAHLHQGQGRIAAHSVALCRDALNNKNYIQSYELCKLAISQCKFISLTTSYFMYILFCVQNTILCKTLKWRLLVWLDSNKRPLQSSSVNAFLTSCATDYESHGFVHYIASARWQYQYDVLEVYCFVHCIVCTRFTVQYDIWKCDVSYVILDLLYRKIDTSSITTNVGFTHVHPICIPISHFSNALCISTVCGRVLVLSSNIITLSKLLSLQVCIWVWLEYDLAGWCSLFWEWILPSFLLIQRNWCS